MQPHANITEVQSHPTAIKIRKPTVADAAEISRLVRDCDVLDTNSCYAYLLVCRDFSATSLVASSVGQLLGFVAAYVPPSKPDVVFVWQIGVSPTARNQGVAKSLLLGLVCSEACRDVCYLEATVTPSNAASRRLFQSVADELGGELRILPGFAAEDFDTSEHEPEETIRINLNRSLHGDL